MAFYHQYRPQKFRDLCGQEHIKVTLTNALAQGKVSHGFLFSGPKGSGKTTTARLVAKALNCQKRKKGEFEPCGFCLNCLEISAGRALDVLEIDAASNRGIDEIRELREKVRFAPSTASYKIYIIDEVHMLTKEAFNALLKTLEEPPAHAVFVLATTEPQKVPATIISRVQHFDFKRANHQELKFFLVKICRAEKFELEKEVFDLIIEKAEGSYRDALSILEQAVTSLDYSRKKITLELAQKALGLPAAKIVSDFSNALLSGESKEALKILHQFYEEGADPAVFNEAVIEYFRQKMLHEPDASKELAGVIEELISAGREMKVAPIALLPLEMVIVRHSAAEKPRTLNPKIIQSSISPRIWQKILETTKNRNHSLVSLLQATQPIGVSGEEVKLAAKFKFHQEQIRQPAKRKILEEIFSQVLNHSCRIVCQLDKDLALAAAPNNDILEEAREVFEV